MSLDLRLALPAAAVWLTSGVLIGAPQQAGVVAWALWLSAGGCTAVLVASRVPLPTRSARRARQRAGSWQRPSGRWQSLAGSVVLCCAGAALVATAVGVWEPVRLPPEVRAAAQSHAPVTATVTVRSVPVAAKAIIGNGISGRVRYRATLTQLERHGDITHVSSPILVFAQAARNGNEPEIGVSLEVRATLRATEPGDATVALLFATDAAHSVGAAPWWLSWANGLRARFTAAATSLAGDGGDLLPGLAIGDTSAVSPDLDTAMKTSSLIRPGLPPYTNALRRGSVRWQVERGLLLTQYLIEPTT